MVIRNDDKNNKNLNKSIVFNEIYYFYMQLLSVVLACLTLKFAHPGAKGWWPQANIYSNFLKIDVDMVKSSNTGHANNLAACNTLINAVKEFGVKYNPAEPKLTVVNLEKAYASGTAALGNLQAAETTHSDTIAARAQMFGELNAYTSRVVSIYSISGIDHRSVDTVRLVQRRIRGEVGAKSDTAAAANGTQTKKNTTLQMGYEDRASNFAQLATYVEANPHYKVNEDDIKTEAVRQFSSDLNEANSRCIETEAAFDTARTTLTDIFYTNEDSLYNLCKNAKAYVKGAFGPSSKEFRRISGIEFKQLYK